MGILTAKKKKMYLGGIIVSTILLASLFPQAWIIQLAYAPGKMGGGFKPYESFRETFRDSTTSQIRDKVAENYEQKEPYREDQAEVLGSGERLGYPHGSTLLKYIYEPKFGTRSTDSQLIDHFLSKGGLELLNNRPEFVKVVLSESTKLLVEEPLSNLESFMNANFLIYLIPLLESSIVCYKVGCLDEAAQH